MKIKPIYILFGILAVLLLIYTKFLKNIETMEPSFGNSFCKKYEQNTGELEGVCEKMTTSNCKTSNCCVWLNNNKCSAGNSTGPTFTTDKNGESITVDTYYYQNKCYGLNCSVLNNINIK
jgi:hypothetical protein